MVADLFLTALSICTILSQSLPFSPHSSLSHSLTDQPTLFTLSLSLSFVAWFIHLFSLPLQSSLIHKQQNNNNNNNNNNTHHNITNCHSQSTFPRHCHSLSTCVSLSRPLFSFFPLLPIKKKFFFLFLSTYCTQNEW